MNSRKKSKRTGFEGTIKRITAGANGDIDGLLLDEGVFVKLPPRSILDRDKIELGRHIRGTGKCSKQSDNRVFARAKIKSKNSLLADDSHGKKKRDALEKEYRKKLTGYPQEKNKTWLFTEE